MMYNIWLQGLVYMVEKRKPGSLRVADKAIPALYNDPRSAFLTTTVRDLLFDGNVINCTSTAFAPSAICSAIRSQSASLHQVSEDIFKFSLFGVVRRRHISQRENKIFKSMLSYVLQLKSSAIGPTPSNSERSTKPLGSPSGFLAIQPQIPSQQQQLIFILYFLGFSSSLYEKLNLLLKNNYMLSMYNHKHKYQLFIEDSHC